MDYTKVIDAILIGLAIFEQLLGYLPEGYPHSTAQLFIFILVKIWRLIQPPKKPGEIIVL